MVGRVEILQASQFPVDDLQLGAEELGLLGVGGYPLQVLHDLFSQSQVLVVDEVQVLVHGLDTNML